MPMNDTSKAQIEGLATLLVLDEEIRKLSSIREFGFFSTNETHRLLSYHTSYLWELKNFIGSHLVAQSGTAEVDVHAPVNQWMLDLINKILPQSAAKEIHTSSKEKLQSIPGNENLIINWPDSLPDNFLWCPLLNKTNEVTGGLIFFREAEFSDSEIKMLRWLIASYQYTWLVLLKPEKIFTFAKLKRKPYLILFFIILATILFFPIRLSVFGDGTVSAKDPVLINAPIQGVIQSFGVSPGDRVKEGQLLLSIDKTDLKAAVEVSTKDFLLTQARLRTAINQGFDNKDSRSEIPILQSQLAIDKAHLDYTKELLAKADVKSPINGVVIFDSKEDWLGQPVKTGERIMIVANEKKIELKISVPISNSIQLSIGDKGEFFLYGQLNSLPFVLKNIGYNAKLTPNKILTYQYVADFLDTTELPQLGTQGTAKIYGPYVPFIYYLLRRPLQAIRQTLGI